MSNGPNSCSFPVEFLRGGGFSSDFLWRAEAARSSGHTVGFHNQKLGPVSCLGGSTVKPFRIRPFDTFQFGRHLVGVWIGGVWNGHFPESEKIIFRRPKFPGKSLKFRRKSNILRNSGSEI